MYYNEFWSSCLKKNIPLDLESNYEFIKFIAHLPDEFFKKLVLPVVEFYENKKTIDLIIDRKHNLPFDFKQFYNDLAKKRKEKLILPIDVDPKKMLDINSDICSKLRNKIAELKKIKMQLQQKPGKQLEIKAIICVDGFKILHRIYQYCDYKSQESQEWRYVRYVWSDGENKSLVEICDKALQQLADLESSVSDKYENLAIECYKKEIENIKTNGKPSYEFHEINKVVKNILGESL